MNARNFLRIGGVVLVLVGVLGWFLTGPTPETSIFGAAWWFDNAENWTYLILGVVALLLAFKGSVSVQKTVTMLIGILLLLVGAYSLMGERMLGAATLQNPADTILHLVVGIWAVWSAYKTRGGMMPVAQSRIHSGM